MSRRRPTTRDLLVSTAEPDADDGTDPQLFHDRRRWNDAPPRPGRKAQQLGGQVQDALHAILAGLADAACREAIVVAVEPAPHAGRFRVTVAAPFAADVADRTRILERLTAATGVIRTQLAGAIHRRNVPELTFVLG